MHQSDLERFEAVPCLAVRIGKVVCFTPIFGGGTDAKLQLFQKVDVLLLCFVLLLVAGMVLLYLYCWYTVVVIGGR